MSVPGAGPAIAGNAVAAKSSSCHRPMHDPLTEHGPVRLTSNGSKSGTAEAAGRASRAHRPHGANRLIGRNDECRPLPSVMSVRVAMGIQGDHRHRRTHQQVQHPGRCTETQGRRGLFRRIENVSTFLVRVELCFEAALRTGGGTMDQGGWCPDPSSALPRGLEQAAAHRRFLDNGVRGCNAAHGYCRLARRLVRRSR